MLPSPRRDSTSQLTRPLLHHRLRCLSVSPLHSTCPPRTSRCGQQPLSVRDHAFSSSLTVVATRGVREGQPS